MLIEDNIYLPRCNEYKTRKTVRCILLNDKLELGLLLIDRNDKFGKMKHYETPGGGLENNENSLEALHREIQEEVGYTIKNVVYLCSISNEYNLLNRIDAADFYLAFIDEKVDISLDEYEKDIIKGIVWVPLLKYQEYYNEYPPYKVSHIIYQRDQYVIELAINYLKENKLI